MRRNTIESPQDLDPEDWPAFRAQAHAMLDDMLDHVATVREGPVWRPLPDETRAAFQGLAPRGPTDLAAVHQDFKDVVLPFSVGNLHPRFMGWVHGGGAVAGMVAEMLAGCLNANLGGRDHAPIEIERQVTRWMAELFGFPVTASGLFVTGASMANFIAVAASTSIRPRTSVCTRRSASEPRPAMSVARDRQLCAPREA